MDDAQVMEASGREVEMAMMMLVANHMGHNLRTEAQQDAYLNWFVSGVENLLKAAGARATARPNPLEGLINDKH